MYVDEIKKWHSLQSEKSRDDVGVDDATGSWEDCFVLKARKQETRDSIHRKGVISACIYSLS